MTNSTPGKSCNEDFAELAHNLNELRDSLMTVAIALQDYQYAKDLKQRTAAADQSQLLLGAVMQSSARDSRPK